jgi:hypothetical protein
VFSASQGKIYPRLGQLAIFLGDPRVASSKGKIRGLWKALTVSSGSEGPGYSINAACRLPDHERRIGIPASAPLGGEKSPRALLTVIVVLFLRPGARTRLYRVICTLPFRART